MVTVGYGDFTMGKPDIVCGRTATRYFKSTLDTSRIMYRCKEHGSQVATHQNSVWREISEAEVAVIEVHNS
jgi:hypothetical protein